MIQRLMKIGCKSAFPLLLVFALTGAATAQAQTPENLYAAMSEQGVTATISASQLTAGWHIVSSGELGILYTIKICM